MPDLRTITTGLVCLALLSGLLACRTPAGRTPGRVIDDANISATVKTKLFQDPYISGFAVGVDTFEGHVTLTGAVDSEFAKKQAGYLAGTIDGVMSVNNLLIVRP